MCVCERESLYVHTLTYIILFYCHRSCGLFTFPLLFVRISVNSSNVQALLDAANQYQIDPVKKMCVEFLKGQIDATNCLGNNINTYK